MAVPNLADHADALEQVDNGKRLALAMEQDQDRSSDELQEVQADLRSSSSSLGASLDRLEESQEKTPVEQIAAHMEDSRIALAKALGVADRHDVPELLWRLSVSLNDMDDLRAFVADRSRS